MATDRPVISRIVGGILAAAVLGGIGNVLYATLSGSVTQNHRRLIAMCGQFDAAFSPFAGRANRVVLQFQNFDYGNPGDRSLIVLLFYRAGYVMFPDRVGLGDPSAVIFNDPQVLRAANELFDERAWPGHVDLLMRITRQGKDVRIEPYLARAAPQFP